MKTELARSLACVLASAYVVQLKLHGFHWNVKGKDFTEFHGFFGMLQEDIYGSIDGIAENILKLGYDAPGSLSEMVHLSCVDDKTVHVGEPIDMTMQFLHDNEKLIDKIQFASNIAEECREFGIMDFLAGREDIHKKWSWQARAISGLQPSRSVHPDIHMHSVEVVTAPPIVSDDMPVVVAAPCCSAGCVCAPGACACPPHCECPCTYKTGESIIVAASAAQEQKTQNSDMKKLPERKVIFSKETDRALQELADAHNKKAVTGRATNLAVLRTVYRRGANESVKSLSNTASLNEYAMSRVHAFLKLLRTGVSHASTYSSDNDLLPAGHPKAVKSSSAMTASMVADREMYMSLKSEDEYSSVDEAILAFAEYSGLGYESMPAFKAAWTRAVRQGENPFRRAKNLSISLYESKDADLLPRRKADTL